MFEYWFYGHDNLNPELVHNGSTNDWLQFCADVAKAYSSHVLGEFVNALFAEHRDKLDFIRIGDWNFEYNIDHPHEEFKRNGRAIILKKVA